MDISSLYTDLYTREATNSKNTRLSNSLKETDLTDKSDEELMDVCKQFESYFVEQVLKNAMDTFTEGTLTGSDSGSMSTLTSFYKDKLITEYSEKITNQQDLGLAQTLYNQMKRNLSSEIKMAEGSADTIKTSNTSDAVETDNESSDVVEADEKASE